MSDEARCVTLRPKRSSAVWLLLGCSLFVAGGVWMGRSEGWIGYLCAAFFALGIPVALVQLLPGSTFLRVSEDGFTFCSLFRSTTYGWHVIDEFTVVEMKQGGLTVHKMVGFNFVASYDRPRIGRRLSRSIAGCEASLPNTYGMKAEELAVFLDTCLQEFGTRQGEPPHSPEPPAA